jgi:lipopolysaccharide transport system permease protein
MFRDLWRHRGLVFELAKREFSGRYRGSFGGVAWSFAQPLFLLCVYTIAFGVILKMRWGFSGGTADYALMLFAGLIVFNAFSECLIKAPALITGNPNFVKKVVFPLETLAWILALNASVHAVMGILVWFLGHLFVHGLPSPTALLFPVVLVCLFPVLLGVAWLLAALGVVVRDLSELAILLSHALLFLAPIFYSIDAAPPLLQAFLMANPLTFVIEQLRSVLFGQLPSWRGLAVYALFASAFAGLSLMLFRRLRPGFADMI